MDSFGLAFTTSVTINRLVFDTVSGDDGATSSYREIQVFSVPLSAVPEPSAPLALLTLVQPAFSPAAG